MKYITLYTILLLIASTSYSQNNNRQTEEKPQLKVVQSNSVSYQIDSVMLAKKNNDQKIPQKTIAYYTDYINALEQKIAFVKSDNEMSVEADKSGWFKEMEQNITLAKKELEKLKNTP